MTLKDDMQHRVLRYYQVRSDDAPGLTLTYFTARSNFVPSGLGSGWLRCRAFQHMCNGERAGNNTSPGEERLF